MSTEVMTGLLIAGLIIAAFVIRYVVSTIFNKAGDAVKNKLADKKNANSGSKEEKLSDRYKK